MPYSIECTDGAHGVTADALTLDEALTKARRFLATGYRDIVIKDEDGGVFPLELAETLFGKGNS